MNSSERDGARLRRTKRNAVGATAVCALAALLVGCGDSGPSRSEAAAAMTTAAKAELGGLYSNPSFTINVDDLKCAEAGDEIFNCQVLMTAVGPAGSKQSTVSVQFTKLGGEWHAQPMHNQ